MARNKWVNWSYLTPSHIYLTGVWAHLVGVKKLQKVVTKELGSGQRRALGGGPSFCLSVGGCKPSLY